MPPVTGLGSWVMYMLMHSHAAADMLMTHDNQRCLEDSCIADLRCTASVGLEPGNEAAAWRCRSAQAVQSVPAMDHCMHSATLSSRKFAPLMTMYESRPPMIPAWDHPTSEGFDLVT